MSNDDKALIIGQDQWDGMVRNVGMLAEQSSRHDARFDEVSTDLKDVTRELRNVANRLEERHGMTADSLRSDFQQQLREGNERQARLFTWMIAIASIIATVAMGLLAVWFTKENSSTETRFEQEQKRTDDRFERLLESKKEVQMRDAQSIHDLREEVRDHAGKDGHPETIILVTERNKADIAELGSHVARIDAALNKVNTSRFSRADWDSARIRAEERDRRNREQATNRDRELADRIAKLEAKSAVNERREGK